MLRQIKKAVLADGLRELFRCGYFFFLAAFFVLTTAFWRLM